MKNSPKKKGARKILPYNKKSKVQQKFLYFLPNSITSVNTWSTYVFWA